MAAYVIFTKFRTRNQAELDAYATQAPIFMRGHTCKRLAYFTDACEGVEGPPMESVAILEFASLAEAKAWYSSPAYQEASQHRFRGADYGVVIVEGSQP
jgi:uncharacterized protein (DUF1330 family)